MIIKPAKSHRQHAGDRRKDVLSPRPSVRGCVRPQQRPKLFPRIAEKETKTSAIQLQAPYRSYLNLSKFLQFDGHSKLNEKCRIKPTSANTLPHQRITKHQLPLPFQPFQFQPRKSSLRWSGKRTSISKIPTHHPNRQPSPCWHR